MPEYSAQARDAAADVAATAARKIMSRLGMPPDSRWFRFRTLGPIAGDSNHFLRYEWLAVPPRRVAAHTREEVPGDWKEWHGCRVEGFGKLLPEPGNPAVDGPTWTFEFPSPMPDLYVQLWECRVKPPGGPLYAELQWRPGYPDAQPFIGGWTRTRPTDEEINAAWNALGLVWMLEKERRPGPTERSVADARKTLTDAAVAVVSRHGLKGLTIRRLAEEIPTSDRNVSYIFDDALWKMHHLKSQPRVVAAHRNYCS